MKSFKIRVKSPEHSKKIQEYLFSLGYSWHEGKKVLYTDRCFDLAWHEEDKKIGFIYDPLFDNLPNTEVVLIENISYEFKEIPKRNVVKIGEKSYYMDELEIALKNINPI